MSNAFSTYGKKSLAENPEGKRPIGRHIRRWEDSVKMDIR
jgi:hypothetical protein